jgi:hypothetical protein
LISREKEALELKGYMKVLWLSRWLVKSESARQKEEIAKKNRMKQQDRLPLCIPFFINLRVREKQKKMRPGELDPTDMNEGG